MTQKEPIRLFEERKVRAIWDDEQEEWYFSIVDVISILTSTISQGRTFQIMDRPSSEGTFGSDARSGVVYRASHGRL